MCPSLRQAAPILWEWASEKIIHLVRPSSGLREAIKETGVGLVEGWMIAWGGGYWQNHDAEEVVLINWICVYIIVSRAQDTWLPQCALAKLRDTSLGGDQINPAFKVRPLRFEYQLNHF